MQKYWKTIALIAVIVMAVTVFYIQADKLTNEFPHFTFKQLEGNEEAVESIAIAGNLQYSMTNADNESFKMTAEDGTSYMKDESFFKRLQGFYNSEKYEQRKEEHRSFMRGKIDYKDYYDENKNYLAYAEVHVAGMTNEATLIIDVLGKDSGDRIQMEESLDRTSDYGAISVAAVKMGDNQLYVIMEDESNKGTGVQKYTIDLKSKQITEKENLYTGELTSQNGYLSMTYLFNEDRSDTEMMIAEEQMVYDQADSVETIKRKLNHTVVYDLTTDEKRNIEIPEDKGRPVTYDDTTLYLSEIDGKELKLAAYDRKQKDVVEELSLPIETPSEVEVDAAAEADTQYIVREEKLYIAVFYYGLVVSPQLMVVDLPGLNLTYKGKVITEELNILNENEHQNINFNEIEVLPKKES